ncbi:hypothetical protein HDU93_006875, partial [Gonapodya sp. JEL0774]
MQANLDLYWEVDGPVSVSTPDKVKDFIAEFYAIMPGNVGGTKWLGDGTGYAASTN